MDQRAVTLEQAAEILGVSPRSLADKRFRYRVGLAARHVGKKIVFVRADLDAVLERGRERLPGGERR